MKLLFMGIIQWFLFGLGAVFYLAFTLQDDENALDSAEGKVALGIFIASSILMAFIMAYSEYTRPKKR